jgi:hypothetical protein
MEIIKAWLAMLLWGPFVSIGIGFVLPAFGLFLFLLWLMLLFITIVSTIGALFSIRKTRAGPTRNRALKVQRAANGRFIRTSSRGAPSTGRAP